MFKIALTGGPRGGKTTVAEELVKNLRKDYYVYFVPETASELINNTVCAKDVPVIDFQTTVLKRQLFKEREIDDVSRYNYTPKLPITVCDRGAIDNRAYLKSNEQFYEILNERNINWLELLDSYDLVIYLASSTTLDSLEYETQSNEARMEKKEEAKDLDLDTISAWLGHSNIVVIPAKENFQDKIDETIKVIRKQLKYGVKEPDKIDVSDYDISYYENGSYPEVYQETHSFKKSVMNKYKQSVVKRTCNGYTDYLYLSYLYMSDGYHLVDKNVISKEVYDDYLRKNDIACSKYEQIINIFEEGTLHKIIKAGGRTYLETSKNSNILPEHVYKVKTNYVDSEEKNKTLKKNYSMILYF